MEIKVKYSNGKLLSNNKDIILNNVADIHDIAKNDPKALTTKLFFVLENRCTMIETRIAPWRMLICVRYMLLSCLYDII